MHLLPIRQATPGTSENVGSRGKRRRCRIVLHQSLTAERLCTPYRLTQIRPLEIADMQMRCGSQYMWCDCEGKSGKRRSALLRLDRQKLNTIHPETKVRNAAIPFMKNCATFGALSGHSDVARANRLQVSQLEA